MKTLLTLSLLAASAFGQTATISDTIRTPFGGTFSGTVTVSLNSPALAQPLYSGSITLSGWTQAVTVTAGVFTLTLYTNDLITPGGTSYTATYAPTSGSGWKETWIVPTGATTIREIRSTTVPSPSVRFTPSQITQAGATLGQGLKWDGSKWAPADVVANPMTTNGDLITRLGGVPVRVGIGSTNQVLTVSGGMPVWASGITGNASTATALAANGTNCSAGSFPLGVDASGNAESCTAAVTASTGLSDSAALVRNNQANTYTAGSKQTFASNATTAGAAFGGGITADPSSVTAGDFWYRTDLGTFGFRNASAVDALVAGGRALTTVGSVPFVTAAGVLGQSANLFWDNANGRLGVGTNAPNNPLQVVSTATSAHSIFVSAPATNSAGSGFGFASNNGANTGLLQLDNSGNLVLRQAQSSMFFDFASQLNFRTNAGVTQLMRLLSNGNLLLGTTTDDGTNRLQVAGAVAATQGFGTAGGPATQGLQFSGSDTWVNAPIGAFTIGARNSGGGVVWQANTTSLNMRLGSIADGNFRLDVGSSGSSGTLRAWDQTPTTGSTSLIVRAGAGQGGNLLQQWQDGSGTRIFAVHPTIGLILGDAVSGGGLSLSLGNSHRLRFAADGATWDTSLSRASANTLQVGDGSANSNGDLAYREWRGTARTFANLGTPADGTFVYCSNCTIANPCASGGTGAFARRLNAAWVCSDGGGGGGSGTVTSVSVSTGLLSVANPTTTPDISIAGTSGGVPYFSSGTTLASSAALDAGALVVGGGAGGAPTILANSSVPNAGELRISTTPTPGATRSVFTLGSAITGGGAGANAGTFYALNAPSGFVGDFMRFELNGAAAFAVNRLGTITVGTANTFGSAGVSVSNVGTLAFANTSSGASAAFRITGSAGTGSGNFLALRPSSSGSGPDVLRVNADQRGVMVGQTAETASVSNLSLGVFDDTASTGVTRHLIQKAANQGTVSPFEVRDFNATLGDGALLFEIEPDGSFRSLPTGTRPTCASGIRGTYWYTQGGTGVKDAVEVCTKDAADVYAWRVIY